MIEVSTSPEKLAYGEAQRLKRLESLNGLGDRLTYGFSTRFFGNMAFTYAPDSSEGKLSVVANRRQFVQGLGLSISDLVVMRPVHGANIEFVSRAEAGRGAVDPDSGIPDTDGLITCQADIGLVLNPADCTPIIITDNNADFVALIHAGRDGTDRRIAQAAVKKLGTLGFDPGKFLVGIGPTTRCYEQAFIETAFPEYWERFLKPQDPNAKLDVEAMQTCTKPALFKIRSSNPEDKLLVDLVGINIHQLFLSGVPLKNIEVIDFCTDCAALKGIIFSHSISEEYKKDPQNPKFTLDASSYTEGRFMSVVRLNG